MGLSRDDERPGVMKTISNCKFQIANLSSDRGVALVVVLWVFIFLFVVAFDFAASVRQEGAASYRYAEEAEGYYLAVAGFEDALYRLLMGREATRGRAERGGDLMVETERPVEYGVWREVPFGTGFYRVRIVDEGGKVNLNVVGETTLRTIFTNLGIQDPQQSILVDSILDWRDEDNLHRLNGAEDDYYLSLSFPYTVRNGRFDTVEDLLWVRGVTAEVFYGSGGDGILTVALKDIFTVDGRIKRVNLRTASAEVIHALVGLSLAESQRFVEERKKLSEETLADLLDLLGLAAGGAAMRQFVFINPSVVTIEAMGYHEGSVLSRQLRGTVRMVGGSRGFDLLRWVDRVVATPPEIEG